MTETLVLRVPKVHLAPSLARTSLHLRAKGETLEKKAIWESKESTEHLERLVVM